MALIRATCRDCGNVEIRSRGIRITYCEETKAATYVFRCPVCRMLEARIAEEHVLDVLLAAGARLQIWHLPPELIQPVGHEGAPLTHDELLDFHILLSSKTYDDIMEEAERLTQMGGSSP